jgi:hypothetical protein
MWKANHIELITFRVSFRHFFRKAFSSKDEYYFAIIYFLFLEMSNFLDEVIFSEKARIAKLYTYDVNISIVINIFIDYNATNAINALNTNVTRKILSCLS